MEIDRSKTIIAPIHGRWADEYVLDPITGLIAFPNFIDTLPSLILKLLNDHGSIGLAIGDVNNLKSYVETLNDENPWMFGHLAGNAFMSKLGTISLSFFKKIDYPWSCISTFGGDEIILACAGKSQIQFLQSVRNLSQELETNLPRSVSFAAGWFAVPANVERLTLSENEVESLCISAISLVDKALFSGKHKRKLENNQVAFISVLETRWLKQNKWCLKKGVVNERRTEIDETYD